MAVSITDKKIGQISNLALQSASYFYLSLIIIGFAFFSQSPWLYLIFIGLAVFFILPDRYLLGLCLLIFLTMFFERHFALQGLVIDRSIYKLYLIDIVFGLTILAYFISYKYRQIKLKVIWGLPEKLLFIFMVLVSAYLIRSFFDINTKFPIAFSSFKNYLLYPLIYFFVAWSVDSSEKLKKIVHLFLLASVGLIIFIFIGLVRGAGLWSEFTPLSTAGVRYLAGTHAFYLSLALTISISLLLYGRLRNYTFSLFIMSAWAFGIGVSLMRHLWLATVLGVVALFVLADRPIKKIFSTYALKVSMIGVSLAVGLALVISLTYFSGSSDKLYQTVSAFGQRIYSVAELSEDSSANWRQSFWYESKKIWLTNPLLGIGFGRSLMIDDGKWQTTEEIRNIHNSPLSITVQMGLLGIGIFVFFILSVLFSAWLDLKNHFDLKPYYLGIIGVIVVFLSSSFFQPYLETNMMGIWLWLFLGLLRTAKTIKEE